VATKLRTPLLGLSIVALLFLAAAIAIWLAGGFNTELFGLRLRARDPWRPLGIGAALLVTRFLLRCVVSFDAEARILRHFARPEVIAWSLAILTTCVSFVTNYGVAGGSDSYGYVSQADLWLKGDLTVEQEWLRGAPWPFAIHTASPLGYRPSPAGGLVSVPTYGPGLPLLFAGGKAVFGQCGIVMVIATMAGLLVAATFWVGRRIASPQIGAAAAWLMATCPVVLFMMASPMSDVPAAALTTLAVYFCLRRSAPAALLAGTFMAAVILIRPNLTPLGSAFAVWLLVADRDQQPWRARLIRCAAFCLAAACGAGFMAYFNASLYESATSSGYGDIEGFFEISHILPNIRNYATWLVQAQSPLAAAGLAALIIPARWLNKTRRPADLSLLLLVALGVIALYLPYLVFDRWWYLRFFLPIWPAAAIGTGWLLASRSGQAFGRAGIATLLIVGGWGLYFAQANDAFKVGRGDLRYVSAAHAVREMTPPGSVILSMQHSGSLNYYSGRKSLRYDWLPPGRLDDAVRWLRERGHEVYILLEEWEVEIFRRRFAGTQLGALADETMIFRQEVGTRVLLFDTRSHLGERPRAILEFVPSARRCCEPERR
jgi:hypothetical protein